jgi:hypothetical protein
MSTNIYTIQKSLDSIFGIKFTPSVPNSAFKVSQEQLLLEGKVVLDENGKDTGHNMYGKTWLPEARKLFSESQTGAKNNMYGKTHSEETKKKMSISMTGAKGDCSLAKSSSAKKAIVTWKGIEYRVDCLKEFCIKYHPGIAYSTLVTTCRLGLYCKKWDVSAKYL